VSRTEPPARPGPSWWDTLALAQGPADAPVVVGGAATPDALVGAYRAGVFPWPSEDDEDDEAAPRPGQLAVALRAVSRGIGLRRRPAGLPWWCPDPRAVIPAGQVRTTRSLRGRLRSSGWMSTVDQAFDEVVGRCRRTGAEVWITDELRAGYTQLHALGWAHSLEVWNRDRLVGGAFGVLVGGVFVGESMFHEETDASKAALVDLDARFAAAGGRLVDVQIASDHMRSLGAVEIARADYLAVLRAARDDDVRLVTDRLPVARLAAPAGAGPA
jgi:leucyl/phenylalanyl-tRNA--protein transferase